MPDDVDALTVWHHSLNGSPVTLGANEVPRRQSDLAAVLPNPTDTEFRIEPRAPGLPLRCTLSDAGGRVLDQSETAQGTAIGASLDAGVYFLQIVRDEEFQVLKLVKTR